MAIKSLDKVPPQLPVLFDATASSLVNDAKAVIQRTITVWQGIVAKIQPQTATFANTILPIIHDENISLAQTRILRFYSSTSPSEELRAASNAATALLNDAEVDLYSRVDIFSLVKAVADKINEPEYVDLDSECKHYVKNLHRKFYVNGCGISDSSTRQAFETAHKKIQQIVRQAIKNLNDDPSGLWLTLEELEGVPKSIVDRLAKGEGDKEGQFWLKTKIPHPNKVLSHAKREDTRKKVYYAIKNRLPENRALHRELVLLRDETARYLGYTNYLALSTAGKMSQTPEMVTEPLEEIRQRLAPHALRRAHDLLKLKIEDAAAQGQNTEGTKIFAWDDSYYTLQQQDKQKSQGLQAPGDTDEYFELYYTLEKLLELFGHLFDTRFERITHEKQMEISGGKPLVWHEDVDMFAVWDAREDDTFLGYAYLDFFPREGKYGHRGCYATQWGYNKPDGSWFYPSEALVMNYIKPRGNKPTFLGLEDVRSLFHELGHLHHGLLTKVRHASLFYIDRDFTETPCQVLEQFFWVPRHIKEIGFHYSHISPELKAAWLDSQAGDGNAKEQPEAQLSDEQITELVKSYPNTFIKSQISNLFLALYDVKAYSPSTRKELEETNLTELFNKLRLEITQLSGGEAVGEGWEWSHGEAVFRSMVGNYAAGYYTYVLGRVYSLDMWNTEFKADTMSKKAGQRFRDMILAVGGGQPELKTLTDYLGHKPSNAAYFDWLGI